MTRLACRNCTIHGVFVRGSSTRRAGMGAHRGYSALPACAGCVALPRFPRRGRGMRGTATVSAQGTWDTWHCHGSRAAKRGAASPRPSSRHTYVLPSRSQFRALLRLLLALVDNALRLLGRARQQANFHDLHKRREADVTLYLRGNLSCQREKVLSTVGFDVNAHGIASLEV